MLQRLINLIRRQPRPDAIELHHLRGEIHRMANELAGLTAQVSATADVLGLLVAKVNAGGIDPADVAAATAALKTATDAAAAVLQPPAPVEPPPAEPAV
jgi:hypothetical protein